MVIVLSMEVLMAQSSKLLNSSVVALAKEELHKLGSNAYVGKKLYAVIAASKHGITKVAAVYDVSRTTLTEWIKHLKNNTPEKLKSPPSRKRKRKLSDLQMVDVKSWIQENPNITIKSLRIRIAAEMFVDLSKSAVHTVMKKLKFSYISPRPVHYKQDKSKHEEFKKKSQFTSEG